MNVISALVVFDLGVARSFVSLALSKRFVDDPGELEYPLHVKIAHDRPVRVSRVHWGCIFELFSDR